MRFIISLSIVLIAFDATEIRRIKKELYNTVVYERRFNRAPLISEIVGSILAADS
jgi:hypothetical protein